MSCLDRDERLWRPEASRSARWCGVKSQNLKSRAQPASRFFGISKVYETGLRDFKRPRCLIDCLFSHRHQATQGAAGCGGLREFIQKCSHSEAEVIETHGGISPSLVYNNGNYGYRREGPHGIVQTLYSIKHV
jgi:hypothetical protein